MRLRSLAVLVTALSVGLAPQAVAQDNPYERGPDPTESSISASRGPFATADLSVSRLVVTGFGGGTIYYPTSTAEGTFGAIAVSPGFTATQSSLAWLGPRLASQGFVVMIIDTNSLYDQPNSRGDQLLAALSYLTERSSVRGRIDSSRLAVAGHSMGGGGTLEAAKARPGLQAAIPLQPWHTDKTWPEVQVPTMIIGAEADTTAAVANHSEPFYQSIPTTTEKAYLELNNAEHRVGTTGDTTQAKFMIVWLKRYVDNDTRYEQFICPPPSPSAAIEEYRHTCPG